MIKTILSDCILRKYRNILSCSNKCSEAIGVWKGENDASEQTNSSVKTLEEDPESVPLGFTLKKHGRLCTGEEATDECSEIHNSQMQEHW